jgi:phosphoserine phosphatase
VVLDVDSTLSGVEGIDWLASLRGPDVARRIAQLTDRAMNGEMPLEAVYGERLAIIRPTRSEIDRLARVYRDSVAVGATDAIAQMRRAGVRVILVSGGVRQAIEPLATDVGAELHAVSLSWTASGDYQAFDERSPLVTQPGKESVVRELALPRPSIAMGDGSTDVAMRAAVDEFAAFIGFVRRDAVVAAAGHVFQTFAAFTTHVMGTVDSPR